MLATKLSSKGQIVIPKELRKKLKVTPGTFFKVHIEKGDIVLTPVKMAPIDKLYGRFAGERILDELERDHGNELAKENRT